MASRQNRKTVIIIGAGYTGLATAYYLAKKGYSVKIIESSNAVGGLASGFKIEGTNLEKAYHHIFKTDSYILKLSEELGISHDITWNDSSLAIYHNGVIYPFKSAKDLMLFKPLHLHNRIRAGMVVLYLQKLKKWRKLEKISAYDWMQKYAGKQVTKVIWEPLLRGKFDKDYNKVSMAWLWARIHIRSQSREKGGEKLGYYNGGFNTFTVALVNKLNKLGVEIQKNTNIKEIASENDMVKIKYANNTIEHFNDCVATIPSTVFAKLIEKNSAVSNKYLTKLRSVKYLGARILVFSSTQEISQYYWHNVNDKTMSFLVFINHTKLINKSKYNGKYVYYIAAYLPMKSKLYNVEDKDLEKKWFLDLHKMFPAFDENEIVDKHYFRFNNAQHIVGTDYVNTLIKNETPLNNIYLANFSQIYPEDRGTNYAIREGLKVANIILKK